MRTALSTTYQNNRDELNMTHCPYLRILLFFKTKEITPLILFKGKYSFLKRLHEIIIIIINSFGSDDYTLFLSPL